MSDAQKMAGITAMAGLIGLGLLAKKVTGDSHETKKIGFGTWSSPEDYQQDYDFVIIGGGTAGCALAARLTEDPKVRVLVLEAGYSDNITNSKTPATFPDLFFTDCDWNIKTVPQKHANDREMAQPRGKLLGGSSALNAMMHQRGAPSDFDHWENNLGNTGWNYKEALHYFKKAETFNDPSLPSTATSGPMPKRQHNPEYETFDPQYHGTTGPWQTGYSHHFKGSEVFVDANIKEGIQHTKDFNGATTLGTNLMQTFISRKGVRSSSSRSYLGPKGVVPGGDGKRGLIRVVFGVNVERIVLATRLGVKIAVAVEFRDHKKVLHKIAPLRETLLCGGAFGSPHVLLASGIGPAPQLSIPHVHTLRGVGQNLQDHIGVSCVFQAGAHADLMDPITSVFNLPGVLYDYHMHRVGPLTSNGGEAATFARMEQIAPEFVAREKLAGTWVDLATGPDAPHVEIIFLPAYLQAHAKVRAPDKKAYYTIIVLVLNPSSSGTVNIKRGKDGKSLETVVDPNYFADDFDLRLLTAAFEFTRKLGRNMLEDPRMGPQGHELVPGKEVDTFESLKDFVRSTAETIYHPVSTCRMGATSDPMAVVDTRLNVHGIDRLRVIDASAFPQLPAAHTCAPVLMMAEKAADMIKEDWKEVSVSAKANTIFEREE